MSDSAAGDYAALGSEEIVNAGRTIAYLDAGYGPPNLTVDGGCSCAHIRELAACDEEEYVSPAADPAPWYDASIPESGDFAGFLPVEFTGLGSTYARSPIEKVTGGSVLGRLRADARELTWRGYLFGRSCCAVQYGLRWLAAQLVGTKCYCGGEDLDLLICCPDPVSGAAPPCASLPTASPISCPPYTVPNAFRTLKNVGLLSGPEIVSERKVGCGSTDGCGDGCVIEVEFTLLAGNPFLYGCPITVCVEAGFEPNPDCVEFIKVPPGTLADCLNECPDSVDCSDDPGCPRPTLPTFPEFEDRCFCDPLDPVRICCDIQAEDFGQFFEGAPIIEIYSGSAPMRATTVRFYNNPQGRDCEVVDDEPCFECDSIQVRYIPPESTLTIDGTNRTVTLQCPGQGEPVPAEHLTVTPFAWPTLTCIDYCVCVETEGMIVAADASVTIGVMPREM